MAVVGIHGRAHGSDDVRRNLLRRTPGCAWVEVAPCHGRGTDRAEIGVPLGVRRRRTTRTNAAPRTRRRDGRRAAGLSGGPGRWCPGAVPATTRLGVRRPAQLRLDRSLLEEPAHWHRLLGRV